VTLEGFTLWLTGLSGAGKSTLALAVSARLRERGHTVEILDGDDIRRRLSTGLGYSKADRDTNVRRIGYVARLLSRNGVVVIAAVISPYRGVRQEVRLTHEGRFVEVFVDCPLDELIRRDTKGLYARALRGEIAHFTGVSDPYEAPLSPEVVLRTDHATVDESVETILQWLEAQQFIRALKADVVDPT
jgi:adenylyl-sulfate kinase